MKCSNKLREENYKFVQSRYENISEPHAKMKVRKHQKVWWQATAVFRLIRKANDKRAQCGGEVERTKVCRKWQSIGINENSLSAVKWNRRGKRCNWSAGQQTGKRKSQFFSLTKELFCCISHTFIFTASSPGNQQQSMHLDIVQLCGATAVGSEPVDLL